MAQKPSGDRFAGAESAAVRRHRLPLVHGRGARPHRLFGGPVLFDRVLWQRPAVLGHDVCLCSARGGALATYALEPSRLIDSGVYTFVRAVTYRISSVYAVKMAGVFMISLGTIWVRTRVMPRWLAWLTYVLAVGLLLSIGSSLWVMLIFPAWVCAVSVYILAYQQEGIVNLKITSRTAVS